MSPHPYICILCVLLMVPASAAPTDEKLPLTPEPVYARIATHLARSLPSSHLTRSLLDDSVSARAWTNYLSSLDFEHVYFLQSDVDGFKDREHRLDDCLSEGNLDFAYEVFEIFKQRVADRCGFVEQMLEKGFDLDKDERYTLRRRDLPWPRDEEERDEIWRKKIKNEYLRQIIGREFSEAGATNSVDNVTTNVAAEATSAVSATNSADSVERHADQPAGERKPPSPEETVLKRYTQLRTVLNDSDSEWVLQKYLTAFAHAYDPHSLYMTPDAKENFNIEMSLSLTGIGALLRAEDGAAKIVRLIPGGPADRDKSKNRLQAGDKIIAVGQGEEEPVDILHWPLNKIVGLIRGEKGTRVVLVVIPSSDPTESTTKTVELVRDEVKLEEQAASAEVRTVTRDDGTVRKLGLVTLPAFYANPRVRSVKDPEFRSSSFDVAKAINGLLEKDVDGILLDLRNNGGGFMQEASRMVGLFIRTGPTVMMRDRKAVRVLSDDDPTVVYRGPLVVLVNRLSASASEIVAGALQDYDRAIIVGDSKTHGKGTVQTIVQMGLDPRLGSVKVTTASYYRISGSSTQLRGIKPDIVIPSPYDFMEVGEDHLPNPMKWSMAQPVPHSPVTDLDSVVEALRARSKDRRRTDKRYEVYKKLLRRIKALSESREVPLNIDERRKMAATEKELANLQEELSPVRENESDNGNGDKDVDVVLAEAFRILSDFSDCEEARLRPEPVEAATNGKKSWPELIEQMLRKL